MKNNSQKKPFKSIWFGNFFEPAYSDSEYVKNAIDDIKEMGFTDVELDSKSWQDFFDRYAGKPASQYVKMQEYMIDCIQKAGLNHWFLAIYLNGDNLYPSIRFSPPVIGEGVADKNGNDIVHYKYWSEKAQKSMTDHVKGLFSLYGCNHTKISVNSDSQRLPICSMWDPIAMPSFDADGVKRYRDFLSKRYSNIGELNRKYKTSYGSFDEIKPEDYWITNTQTSNDYKEKTPTFYKYTDNLLYKSDELVYHFKTMSKKLHALDERLYLMPNISQWSIFLNINRHENGDLWDTANRGVDPYRIAEYVDCATFMTVPMLPDASPNPYVTQYQNSMMRMMNKDREFAVGFYLGRHTANDIYREIAPAEIIAAAVSCGASGYHAYGYCGLDDGGVMHKLSKQFKRSIADANRWADIVLNLEKGKLKKQAALLFPSQMATTEGYCIDGNEQRRLDSIGIYQIMCDNAIMTDVIHIDQIEKGILDDYKMLVLSQNSCYELEPSAKAEGIIKDFVENGGILISSYGDPLTGKIFGNKPISHKKECIRFNEGFIPTGNEFATFSDGKPFAFYEDSKLPACVITAYGSGKVYQFGYSIGSEYLSKENEAVPPEYSNRAYYPLNLTNEDPMSFILKTELTPLYTKSRGISYSAFENGTVIINYTSYPFDTSEIKGEKIYIYNMEDSNILAPHSAVYIKQK